MMPSPGIAPIVCRACGATFLERTVGSETMVAHNPTPDGHWHHKRCRVRGYRCEKGHAYPIALRDRCTACDWVGECHCHQGAFVDEWPFAPKVVAPEVLYRAQ